jgi:DNA repair protein RecO (recombination protein O)
MERELAKKGIVLRSQRTGSVNRLLSVLTEEGVIFVVSYGAAKGKKSVKAELCAEGTFFLYYNPVRKQYSLRDLALESDHETLRDELYRNYVSLFFCEVALKMNGGDGKGFLSLLSSALFLLEKKGIPPSNVLIQYIWNLIDLCGLRPDLSACPVCDRAYGEKEILGFSTQLTAPCCLNCATVKDDMLLPPGARRYLALTASMDVVRAVEVPLNPEARTRIKRYLLRYAALLSGGKLRTLEGGILQQMETNDLLK